MMNVTSTHNFLVMNIIRSERIPPPKGHYSACIEHNGLLYISGQLPTDPAAGEIPEGIKAQTQMVLDKIGLILREAGSAPDQVIQMRIYIADISLWDQVNRVYAGFFGAHRPARCVVPVATLHYGCLIEAEAIPATRI